MKFNNPAVIIAVSAGIAFFSLSVSGCGPSAELEEENAMLRGSLDSLRRLNYDCTIQNARLAGQIDSLKTAEVHRTTIVPPPPSGVSEPVKTPESAPRVRVPVALPPAAPQFQSDYQNALYLYRQKDYAQSIVQFRALAAATPANDLTDNCEYWSGECQYAMEQYAAALERFGAVLAYAESDKRDDALMMRGNCYLRLNDPLKARAEFRALVEQYPESEYAARAREKMNTLPAK